MKAPKNYVNTMTEKRFEEIVDITLNQLKETLIIKGKEYRRNNDPFHNFNQGARKTGLTRENVLDGFLLKHEISIEDMTNDLDEGILPSLDKVEEKFNDNLIYLLIKKASIIDKIEQSHKHK